MREKGQDALPPVVPSDWKSCSETVFLSLACWFFFFSFFPPLSFARDFGGEFFVLGTFKKKTKRKFQKRQIIWLDK